MKIAINLTRDFLGGITTSNLSLLQHLHRNDCEFVGIELTNKMYMKGTTLFRTFAPELFDHHIINIHHLPMDVAITKAESLAVLKEPYQGVIELVRKILRETKPDVVFLSGTYYIPWILSIAARLEKIPIVLWYSGILSKETEHCTPAKRLLYAKMEKDIALSAHATIFPSHLCKETVEKDVLKKPSKRPYVIPNPLPALFTQSLPVDVSLDRRIAAVGRYTNIKNFDRFFEIHKELDKQKWQHSASFVTNSDISRKNVPKKIEILPPMTPEGLRLFYMTQGLIICPSVFETFGNVAMEAASLGVPVLVSDTMGCAEILHKAGLKNMVISFDNLPRVVERAKQLCGQSILPKQMNAIRRMLDPHLVNEEIRAVISATVPGVE